MIYPSSKHEQSLDTHSKERTSIQPSTCINTPTPYQHRMSHNPPPLPRNCTIAQSQARTHARTHKPVSQKDDKQRQDTRQKEDSGNAATRFFARVSSPNSPGCLDAQRNKTTSLAKETRFRASDIGTHMLGEHVYTFTPFCFRIVKPLVECCSGEKWCSACRPMCSAYEG
jgi:hypothetical protein